MRMSAIELVIKGTTTSMMIISFKIIHGQSHISWMVKEFVLLSELFQMYTFF